MRQACLKMLAATCILSGVCTGCVAINAGKPEIFTNIQTVSETAKTPTSLSVQAARGQAQQIENRVAVCIAADVREGYAKTAYEEKVVVRKQKRLAIGLFPAAAERYLMPDGALDSGVGYFRYSHAEVPRYYALYGPEMPLAAEHFVSILMLGFPYVVGTINSLLVQPFAGWSCSEHDYLDKEHLKLRGTNHYGNITYWDNSDSPKLQALARFSVGDRKKIGVKTCFDAPSIREKDMTFFSHMGLVGCHKYLAVFVEPARRGPGQTIGEEVKMRRAAVEGPYVAELSIPALGYARMVRVGKGTTEATFELPVAARRCVAEAVVRFRADSRNIASDVTRGALNKVAGEEYRFDVTLQGGAGALAPVSAAKPKSPGGTYEVVGITPSGNGRYEVRVRISDKSRTFDVGWAVEADVKRMIREDFANRHPGTGIQYVREIVEWETEEDGAILVYRGWAFSAKPVANGWLYDPGRHRGYVRLRISEGMPAEEAKRWARENIEAIVKEKNVALEAGKSPPEGAMYRSLGESLEDGVLTVEFEAVE